MSGLDTSLDTSLDITTEVLTPAQASVQPAEQPVVQPPIDAPTTKRVLIVDDNADLLTIFTIAMEMTPFTIDTAVDGLDAMEKIQAAKPDVIILDVNMPRMDGFEVLSTLRATPEYEGIKIILLTGNSTVPTYPETSKADLVLSKPVSVEELIHLVHRLAK